MLKKASEFHGQIIDLSIEMWETKLKRNGDYCFQFV